MFLFLACRKQGEEMVMFPAALFRLTSRILMILMMVMTIYLLATNQPLLSILRRLSPLFILSLLTALDLCLRLMTLISRLLLLLRRLLPLLV